MEEEEKNRKASNSCSFINSLDHLLVLLHYTTRHESRVNLKQTRSSEVDFTSDSTYHIKIIKREGSRPGGFPER